MEVSRKYFSYLFLLVAILMVSSCISLTSDKAKEPHPSVARTPFVTWTANRDKLVNSVGGGYRVYYSTVPTFNIANALGVVDVPYVSGAQAPSSAQLPMNLPSGVYYIKVVAYSIYATSNPSTQVAVTVP